MADKVSDEQDLRRLVMGNIPANANYNGSVANEGKAAKDALEASLAIDGYTARVIVWLSDYVKIKFFKDNKLFCTYKAKSDTTAAKTPAAFLSNYRSLYEPGYVPPTPAP